MVTTLYLIRHGETEGSEVKRYKGSIDVPMSEKGIEQIKKTSVFICAEAQKRRSSEVTPELPNSRTSELTAVYCSPLSRALKSAEIIAEPHGLKPIVINDLRERNFGIWEGMSFAEIKEKYPQEFEAWAQNPLKYSPIKGESTLEVRDRVIDALNRILNSAEVQKCFRVSELPSFRTNIAVVAHGGVNRIILCHVMGMPLENIFRIEQDFAAVNIIEFLEKYPVVKLLNWRN